MPPLGMAASLGLGAPRAATSSGSVPSGVSYDEDAQTYFTALEAATGWVEPADYADKKTAISNYVVACKAASNWEKIKALYIPIWQVAAPNALSAKRSEEGSGVTTYDLSFTGTVTHDNGDFIQSDGSTGYCTAPFRGAGGSPTFFGLTDTSYSGNILGGTLTTTDYLLGWYLEANIIPSSNSTSNCQIYGWDYADGSTNTANGGVPGFWSAESQTPSGAYTNKIELWKDGSSKVTKETYTQHQFSTTVDWFILAAGYTIGSGPWQVCQYEVNFVHAGIKMTSQSDFNTDTATLLAAL